MTPARLLLVLKTRWVTAVAVLAAVLALTAGVTALQPRLYTATAVVMVDYQSADPLGSAQVQPQLATGYLAAQVDIL
jgi:succinoglycan biosynthesis transport protein ExoP